MKKLEHCVYVLLSKKDGNFYVGYSSNLHQRLTSHIQGQSIATASRRPFELIFCEYFISKIDALNREQYFKTTKGKRVIHLMLQDSLKELEIEKGTPANRSRPAGNPLRLEDT